MPPGSRGGSASTTRRRYGSGLPHSSSPAGSRWKTSATSGRRRTASAQWRGSPPPSSRQRHDPRRRSGGDGDELVEQVFDHEPDLVADAADVVEAPACGILEVPLQVALPGKN